MDEPFCAFPDAVRFPAGAAHEAIYAPLERVTRVVERRHASLLFACRGFATLDQHAARLAARGFGDRAELRAALGELARGGLMSSANEVVRRVRACQAGREPARVEAIGVPTRDRVADVRAALDSYIQDARAHGRALEYVVAEGEVSDETRAATRASLAELAARHGADIAHAGFEERAAYVPLLARRAGVPEDLVTFAILNPERYLNDTGSGRNAILLHMAGSAHLQVDDDTRCRFGPAPRQLGGLALTSANDPSESFFPPEGVPAMPQGTSSDRCYVALHEALLGRSVSACVEDARLRGLDIEHALAGFFRRLEPTGGRVLTTQIGAAGDTGAGSMWHYLFFSGRTRERLLASEQTYRRAFTGRKALRVARRASISDGSFCLGMTIGIDGRGLLPPFLPGQRNHDGIFGAVLRLAWPDTFVGFVPYFIEHTKQRTSSFEELFATLGDAWAEDMLLSLLAAGGGEAEGADPEKNLRALGAVLVRWASLPLVDFEELVRVQVLRARSLDLALLEEALETYGRAPAFWARDVERAAAKLREVVTRPSVSYPTDLAEVLGMDRARVAMPQMVRRYGELLQAWPNMLAAAVELRREGVRPAVTVHPAP